MESIILAIILLGGGVVATVSHIMIKSASHRPANGELKTLERISKKVDSIANHPAIKHSSIIAHR